MMQTLRRRLAVGLFTTLLLVAPAAAAAPQETGAFPAWSSLIDQLETWARSLLELRAGGQETIPADGAEDTHSSPPQAGEEAPPSSGDSDKEVHPSFDPNG